MKERYEGDDGRRLLTEALKQQVLLEHDEELAARFVSVGTLVEFPTGAVLAEQNAADNSVFFIISGSISVHINGRNVATRGPRQTVGEMALLDPAAPRSATLTAQDTVVVLKVSEAAFQSVAAAYPRLWRPLATVVAQRLRERNRFHRQPNSRPILFLGSSVEGLPIAKQLQLQMKHSRMEVRLWTGGVFGPSGVTIDQLLEQVDACDFCAFIFGADDSTWSREREYSAPRDNVVFELGLFMGKIGRERSFIVKEHKSEVKIPSDLLGVTLITYVASNSSSSTSVLQPVCTEIEASVSRLGVI